MVDEAEVSCLPLSYVVLEHPRHCGAVRSCIRIGIARQSNIWRTFPRTNLFDQFRFFVIGGIVGDGMTMWIGQVLSEKLDLKIDYRWIVERNSHNIDKFRVSLSDMLSIHLVCRGSRVVNALN